MGFFRTEQINGKWMLVDGQNKPFYSLGINCVTNPLHDQVGYRKVNLVEKYGGDGQWLRRWADKKLEQTKEWHFNTLGAWHGRHYWGNHFPKTVEIRCSRYAKVVNKGWGQGFPDVFDPSFATSVHKAMSEFFYEKGEALPTDEGLIGYYTDNELHWWGSFGVWGDNVQGDHAETGIVDDYFELPPEAAGKQAWVRYIRQKYQTVEALNLAWDSEYTDLSDLLHIAVYRAKDEVLEQDKEAFLRRIAEVYFETTSSILRLYDPNHLNLGCRGVGTSTPRVVMDVMKDYVDLISLNFYSFELPISTLDELYRITNKPMMITEFSFCAGNSAGFLHSTNGARKVIVKDQQRRAEAYNQFVTAASKLPYMVGTHWFALYDYGNHQGLIGNYGLLNFEDEPWDEFVSGVADTNKKLLSEFK